ncbi:MAG: hypothetical protein ACYSTS_17970, partial [Planctomycetota bacterium]
MNKAIFAGLIAFMVVVFMIEPAKAQSNGNPYPGFPHDTINIHVQKSASGPKGCNGGHTLFLRTENGVIPDDTILNINTIDWNQVDNDGDGKKDEDPIDGVDNDGDGKVDEDGLEPGSVTKATDCDSYLDHEVSLQIRDTDPRKGFVSTQYWSVRMKGKPGENIDFTTYANQTVSCTVLDDPDGIPNSGDETVECISGDKDDWIRLASINLAEGGCVKQVKLGGKNPVNGGGKTNFCDITDGFLVDVDLDGDGVVDSVDQNIFSISCLDDPDTVDVDESLNCLSSLIWGIDEATGKAKLQIFVSHIGSASIMSGKITATTDGNGQEDVIINYGSGKGVWIRMNNNGWATLNNKIYAEIITTGDMDGNGQDEIIIDFGKSGIWTWMNNSTWVKLAK